MTDTKPTLEEQIIYCQSIKKRIAEVLTGGGDDQCSFKGLEQLSTGEINKSILASLKELQSIRSAEMPEENACVGFVRARAENGNKEDAMVAKYIDALKAFALKEKERANDAERMLSATELQIGIMEPLKEHYKRRAEKAESELAALLAAPAPEPVAYLMIGISQHDENEPLLFLARELDIAEKYAKDQGVPITPLYTTPPAQDTRRLAELIK